MKKGTMIAMGVMILLAGFGVLWLFQMFKEIETAMDKARGNATTFGDESIALLTLNWDFGDIRLRSAQSLIDSDEDGSLTERLRANRSSLGQLRSSTGKSNQPVVESKGGTQVLRATYEAEVVCENGSATITLKLARQPKNSWQIVGIDVVAD